MLQMMRKMVATPSGMGMADAPSPHQPTPLEFLLLDFDSYNQSLKTLSAAIATALESMEACSHSMSHLVEVLAPLASHYGGLTGPSSELLSGATALTRSILPELKDSLHTLALTPLATILTSHSELRARAEERERAMAEYKAATRDLESLQRRHAAGRKGGALGDLVSGALGGALGAMISVPPPSAPATTNPTTAAAAVAASVSASAAPVSHSGEGDAGGTGRMLKVVNRLSASQALVKALEGGLEDELRSSGDRRKLIIGRLFQGVAAGLEVFGEGAASIFPTAPTPGRTSAPTPPALTALRSLVQGNTTEWYDAGLASRAASRASAAAQKEASRRALGDGLPREVPLSSLIEEGVGGAGSEPASPISLVIGKSAHVWLPRVLRGLCVAEVAALAGVSSHWRRAVYAREAPTHSLPLLRAAVVHGGLTSRSGSSGDGSKSGGVGRVRLGLWLTLLGLPTALLGASPTLITTAPVKDDNGLLALVQLALAEGVQGSKDSSAPREGGATLSTSSGGGGGGGGGGGSTGGREGEEKESEEDALHSRPRWMTLIQQDVARSYNASLPFGLTGAVMEGRKKWAGKWRRLAVEGLKWGGKEASKELGELAQARQWEEGKCRVGGLGGGGERHRSSSLVPRGGNTHPSSVTSPFSSSSSPTTPPLPVPSPVMLAYRKRIGTAFSDPVSFTTSEEAGESKHLPLQPPPPPLPSSVAAAGDEVEAEEQRVALEAVMLCVAAMEPTMRYTQGVNALGRLVLHVAWEGLPPHCAGTQGGVSEAEAEEGPGGSGRQQENGGDGRIGVSISTSTYSSSLTPSSSASPLPPCFSLQRLTSLPYRRKRAALVASNLLLSLLRDHTIAATPRLLPLYLPDMGALRLRLYQMDRLLLRRNPGLHATLSQLGVPPSSYASPWVLTLFSNFTALDAPSVVRTWDAMLCCGPGHPQWATILSLCLGILGALSPLLGQEGEPLERILPILRTPRLFYGEARVAAGEGVGGGVWGGYGGGTGRGGRGGNGEEGAREGEKVGEVEQEEEEEAFLCAAVVDYALKCDACKVSVEEMEELESNFKAFGHIFDVNV